MSQDDRETIFSNLMSDIVLILEENLDEDEKRIIYSNLIDIFESVSKGTSAELIGTSVSYDEEIFDKFPKLLDEYMKDLD